MNSTFQKNIEALRDKFPLAAKQIEQIDKPSSRRVIKNGRNVPVFQYRHDEKWVGLTSSYHPEVEAFRQIDELNMKNTKLVFVLGEGGFFHVERILQEVSEDSKVILISSRPEYIKLVFENRDVGYLFGDERFTLICATRVDNIKQAIESIVNADLYTIPTFSLIEHPTEEKIQESFFTAIKTFLHSVYTTSLANLSTTRAFEHWWSHNFICNIPHLLSGVPVDELKNSWENKPVIIVGAGPSLSKNIDLLQKVKGRALILCVDTAYRILQRRNIIPDLIITLDGSPMNAEHMSGCDYDEIPLLMDVYSHRDIFKRHTSPKVVISSVEFHDDWWKKVYGSEFTRSTLALGGSVATAGFSFARLIGADPIIVMGVDLSYPNGQCYAPGALHESRTVNDVSRDREMYPVLDIHGETVYTTFDYLYYLRWFQEQTKNIDRECINATEGGALREGFTIKPFSAVIEEKCDRPLPVDEWLNGLQFRKVDREVIHQVWTKLKRSRREIKAVARFLQFNTEFLDRYIKVLENRDLDQLAELHASLEKVHRKLCSLNLAMSFLDSHSYSAVYLDIKVVESIERNRLEYTELERVTLAARQSLQLNLGLYNVARDSIVMHDDGIETFRLIFERELEETCYEFSKRL
jgi:hypothetical protein